MNRFFAMLLVLELLLGLSLPVPTAAGRARAQVGMPGDTDTLSTMALRADALSVIDRYVQEQLEALRIPGGALAIVHGGEIVYAQGYGRADSAGRPMTAQTPSLIGSLTKSFTAVAIMQLVEQGRLDLDAPVQRYLPWFRLADPVASARITLRQLLTHTSGIPGRSSVGSLTREDTGGDAIERQVRELAGQDLSHPPGSAYQYANANFVILGAVVETVSGESYEAYVQRHIFTPLAMNGSYSSPGEARAAGLADGHRFWFGRPWPAVLPYPRGLLPAGYLASNAEDMGRYLIAHLNGGGGAEGRILSPASVAELHRPGVTIDTGVWSGMGWAVIDAGGVKVLQHEGSTLNYRADMYLLPETGWGFVLLMNADDKLQETPARGIGRGVAAILMGQEPAPVALNPLAHTLYAAVIAIATLQLFAVVRGLDTLRRRRSDPLPRSFWRHTGLPLAGSMLVALLFLVLLPMIFLGGSLAEAIVFAPDLGAILAIIGTLALLWGAIYTALAVRLLHRPGDRPMPEVQPTRAATDASG